MRLTHYLSLLLLPGTLLACSGAQPSAATETAVATATATPAGPTLNVPALAGLSIDQVRQRLGAPQEKPAEPMSRQQEAGAIWKNTFLFQGSTLLVTFNARTRVVRDIVLRGNNEAELMHRAGLHQNADEYIVLLVTDSLDVTRTTGIRMVPRR